MPGAAVLAALASGQPLTPRLVPPAELAPLIASSLVPLGLGQEIRRALIAGLADLTVRQAVDQSPFYRERLAGRVGASSTAQLPDLPPLTRGQVLAAGSSIHSRFADLAFCSYTSGTTGRPLIISRSHQEARYLAELFHALRRARARPTLVLTAASWTHGQQLTVTGPVMPFPVSLARSSGFEVASTLLARTFDVQGERRTISEVAGATSRIQQLTAFLRSHHPDAAKHVQRVSTSGQYLDEEDRRELEDFWGEDTVRDTYSLTEMFGGADDCQTCGRYHFSPFVVPEIIDLGSSRPSADGEHGLLVLTALYPFTQMTPLIRYVPGDLAERESDVCDTGLPGYRFLGRSMQAAQLPAGILAPADIVTALRRLPGVRVHDDGGPIPEACRQVGTMPVFRVQAGHPTVLLVETAWHQADAAERSVQLHREICHRLEAAGVEVADAVRTGDLLIRLVGPGASGAPWSGRP